MKPLKDFKFGDSAHDMHYGTPDPLKIFGPGVKQTDHVKMDFKGGHRIIQDMVRASDMPRVNYTYTNKLLVLVGTKHWPYSTCYVFAYSYDDRILGFIEYEEAFRSTVCGSMT